MNEMLEALYDQFGENKTSKICAKEEQRIRARQGNLQKSLTKNQCRQIFRIICDADTIACKMSLVNFASGVRFGVKFMTAVYEELGPDLNF